MAKRFVSVWFRHLVTDWFTLRQPSLRNLPFVVSTPSQGRMIITAANALAEAEGIHPGMAVADARAVMASLQVLDDKPGMAEKIIAPHGRMVHSFYSRTVSSRYTRRINL